MALWGKTDAAESKPKFLSDADKALTVFVSAEEAAIEANKKKGITGAGWWLVKQFTDAAGTPRYKAECLVAMGVANSVSGDAADDTVAADVNAVVTISGQPGDQDTSGGGATFSVTAAVAPSGSVTYQWQKAVAGSTRFVNVSGATSSSIVLTGQTLANDGDRYRVVLSSTTGAPKVVSDAATLSFVD